MGEGDARKLIIETRNRQDCYPLPRDCGEILAVQYTNWARDVEFLLFESPTMRSWLRVFALDKAPQTPAEARNLLKRAYTRITYRPVWIRLNDELYVFPPLVNDGDYLILTVDANTG